MFDTFRRWLRRQTKQSRPRPLRSARRARLDVEPLEQRITPITRPFLVAVDPGEGVRTTDGNVQIQATFSEDMNSPEVTDPNNFALFDSQGNKITINNGDITYNSANFQITITPPT